MSVVEFEVTYGDAMASVKFRRATDLEGMAADLNPGGSSVYLWVRRADDGEPVTSVRVVDGDTVPDGFVRLPFNLTKNGPPRYLCLRTAEPDLDPLAEVKICFGDQRPGASPPSSPCSRNTSVVAPSSRARRRCPGDSADEDFERLDTPLAGTTTAAPSYLWFKRGEAGALPRELRTGGELH